jgi:hypothetical protein
MHLRRWREKIINELVFLLCHYSLSLSSEGFLMNPNGTAQAVVVAAARCWKHLINPLQPFFCRLYF